MSGRAVFLTCILSLWPHLGDAQQLTTPTRWDVGGSVGLFSSNPAPTDSRYGGDWYFEGRYAASLGRYWTEHFKTELEFAATTEGSRFTNVMVSVPGVPANYPLSRHENFQLNQVAGRAVWQFFKNSWIHPYVFGGLTFDAQRHEVFVPEQYFFADPRTPLSRVLISPEIHQQDTAFRVGTTAGVGAKVYFTKAAFFNTAFIATYTRPARTTSFTGGFGVDF